MEGIGQIFNNLIGNGDNLMKLFFNSLDEHQTFWSDPTNDFKPIFSHINTLLEDINTQDHALNILVYMIPQCPLEVLEQHINHHVSECTKMCINQGSMQTTLLSYRVLKEVLKKSFASAQLRLLVLRHLPKIVEAISPTEASPAVQETLGFLELAMEHYPGTCCGAKGRIRSFLYSLIDSTEQQIVNGTARCMLLLQQIGSNETAKTPKKTWQLYYTQLVDTIQDLLNKIFVHTRETFDVAEDLNCLKFKPIPETKDPVHAAQLLSVRVVNLIVFLDHAIVGPYPVPKTIVPFKALNLVLRGLSVSCSTMGRIELVENVAFGTFLPTIHYALLDLLGGLVLALGSNLLMYANLIYEMFPKCLKATQVEQQRTEGVKKSFTRLRVKIYESIQLWCAKLGYGSCIERVNEAILEHIVCDITPYASEVTLEMNASTKLGLSVKRKRKMQKEQNEATELNQSHSSNNTIAEKKKLLVDSGNEMLCKAALDCLASILQSAGCFIKPVTHTLLQEKILPLCFSLLTRHQLIGLYADERVRVALLRVLGALIVNPHHHCPPPLQYAGYIFNTLQISDASYKVRATAAELARSMELVLHPWKETLHFPGDKAAMKDALAERTNHPLMKLVSQSPANGGETNGAERDESDDEATEMENLSAEKTSPIKPPVSQVIEDDESEGEINESLAVTEGSDESNCAHTDDEPIGWVEEVSSSSVIDNTGNHSVNGAKSVTVDSHNVDDGVITHCVGDESVAEPAVVSIPDSDDDDVIMQVDKDDDDCVEVQMDVANAKKAEAMKENGKPVAPPRSSKDPVSPKRAKISEQNGNNTSVKEKDIDALVDEMVAEFVDEP